MIAGKRPLSFSFMQVHYLGNEGRGTVWEEIIINCPAHIQLLSMSATVANPDDLGFWITKVDFSRPFNPFYHVHASTCCCNKHHDSAVICCPAHDELGMCRASLASPEQSVLSMSIRIQEQTLHAEQKTAYTLGHYSGQKGAVSPHVLAYALQTGTQEVFAHVKAVVYTFVQCALQASGVA